MLIINNEMIARVLTMPEVIEVQEAAFKKLPSGEAVHRPRIDTYFPCRSNEGYFRWGTMEGANDGFFAIRMKSDIVTWPKNDKGGWTEEKYCREPGTYCGFILLLSTENGEPLAFMNDGVMQHMRVGGGAGIGAKYLARQDSHVVGMLGSGGMARSFLEALTCVRDIRRCKVYSPTPANREAFAAAMSSRLGIEVIAVDEPRQAVTNTDIFCACTNSMTPVYDPEWIEAGMHVTNVGSRETPEAASDKFDIIIRQGVAGLPMRPTERYETGIGMSPGAYIGGTEEDMKRLPQKNQQPGLWGSDAQLKDKGKGDAYPDFADLLSGKAQGRTTRDQVTFYRNGGNQGLQFSAVGQLIYRKCREQKLGTQIPTDWFLQDIRD